jgi:hypothetical protein
VLTSTDPSGGSGAWTTAVLLPDPGRSGGLGAVSCASPTLCVAGGSAGLFVATSPAGGAGAWHRALSSTTRVGGVSCPSVALCVVAVATNRGSPGEILASRSPAGGAGTWKAALIGATGEGIVSVSCPSTSLCVAGDAFGNVAISTDPTGGAGAWQITPIEREPEFALHGIVGVSCPSVAFCVAVDELGRILSTAEPTGGTPAWSVIQSPGTSKFLLGVSCPSTGMCVAIGGTDVITSTDPSGGTGSWSRATVDTPTGTTPQETFNFTGLTGVSCPTTTFCVAIDSDGRVVTSSAPLNGAQSWSASQVDGVNSLTSLSCASTTLCAAVDDSGHILTTTEPRASPTHWGVTLADGGHGLLGIACPSVALCVAADNHGNILASTNPTEPTSWLVASVDGRYALTGIACPSTTQCVAVDNNGGVITSSNPAGGAASWTVAHALVPGIQEETGVGTGRGYFYSVSCASVSFCAAASYIGLVTSTDPAGGAAAWQPVGLPFGGVSCPLPTQCFASSTSGVLTSGTRAKAGWVPARALLGDRCVANIPEDPCLASGVYTGGEAAAQFVACPSPTFCAGINGRGFASTSTTRSHIGDWTSVDVKDPAGPFSVSCPSTTFCLGVDAAGEEIIGTPTAAIANGYIGTASVGRARGGSDSVRVPVRCRGASVSMCRVRLTLTTMTPRGRSLALRTALVALKAGRTHTFSMTLKSARRGLLTHRHRLTAMLIASQPWLGGYTIRLTEQTVGVRFAG